MSYVSKAELILRISLYLIGVFICGVFTIE